MKIGLRNLNLVTTPDALSVIGYVVNSFIAEPAYRYLKTAEYSLFVSGSPYLPFECQCQLSFGDDPTPLALLMDCANSSGLSWMLPMISKAAVLIPSRFVPPYSYHLTENVMGSRGSGARRISPSYIFRPFLSFSPVYCPTVAGSTSCLSPPLSQIPRLPSSRHQVIKSPYTHSPASVRLPRNIISLMIPLLLSVP